MSEKKSINDATSSIKGNLYQIYVVLQTAFELKEGEYLYIEKYGDISTSGTQAEVKQYENDPLTDLHENFWKTLKNWSVPEFDISNFDQLILLTTQKIGSKSLFGKWNESDVDKKLEILKKIRDREIKSESIKKFMEAVFQNEIRLKNILHKFILVTESPGAKKLIKGIKETRFQHISNDKKDTALNQLLGYIINPATLGENGWSISYDDFSKQCISIAETYSNGSGIFPHHVAENIPNESLESEFLTKLKEINYFDEVGTQAIKDYFSTRETLIKESWNLGTSFLSYRAYQDELINSFDSKYRKNSRITSETTLIDDSKSLYDEITGIEPQKFRNYINTPSYFRNGVMHIIMDEIEDKRWKLKL